MLPDAVRPLIARKPRCGSCIIEDLCEVSGKTERFLNLP
ncbi:hypothetical protein [Psychromonas sp.]